MRTPDRRLVAVLAALWWTAQPWLTVRYYRAQLGRGAYPPDADSISIPIGFAWGAWLLATPLLGAAVGLVLWRGYRSGVPLTAWGRARWGRASVVTLVALGLAALLVTSAVGDWQEGYPGLALAQVPGLVLLAWLRAGASAGPVPATTGAPAI